MRKPSRLTVLREALAIEAAGGFWDVSHVGAVIGVSDRTVYDLPGLSPSRVRGRGRRAMRRYWPPTVRAWMEAQSDVAWARSQSPTAKARKSA